MQKIPEVKTIAHMGVMSLCRSFLKSSLCLGTHGRPLTGAGVLASISPKAPRPKFRQEKVLSPTSLETLNPKMFYRWVNIGIMENQMEKNMENEMETGVIYRGLSWYL